MPCMDPLHVNDLAMSFCRGFNLAFCLSAWDNALMLGKKVAKWAPAIWGKCFWNKNYIYICMYIIYTYIYIHIILYILYVYVYIYMYMYMYICICVCVGVCMYVSMYVFMYVCMYSPCGWNKKRSTHAFRASCETAGMIKDRAVISSWHHIARHSYFPACVDEVFPTWERAAAAVKWMLVWWVGTW